MSGILVIFLSFFILAFNFRNGYASENKGDWVPREGPNSIALAIGTGHRSWSVSQNMELCERSRIFVPFRADFPDYTETISLALKTLQSFGGGSLQLGMGSYPVSAPIEMLSNTCIMGVRPDVTFIKLLDKAASFGSKAGLLRANKVENIFVGNLTVDGNKASQDATNQVEKGKRAGIQFTLANYVYMRNVAIENNPGNGRKYYKHHFKFIHSLTFSISLSISEYTRGRK